MKKILNGAEVECSEEDILERKQAEATWEAGATKREAAAICAASGMKRWERDLVIAALPIDHPQREKAVTAECAIAALGVRGLAP